MLCSNIDLVILYDWRVWAKYQNDCIPLVEQSLYYTVLVDQHSLIVAVYKPWKNQLHSY